jgi:hypothetical protein
LKRIAILLLLAFVCGSATADPRPWMKQGTPDVLAYHLADRSCRERLPDLGPRLSTAIQASLLRHGIKATEVPSLLAKSRPRVVLIAEVACTPPDEANRSWYMVYVYWNLAECVARRFRMASCNSPTPWLGTFGLGREDDIVQALGLDVLKVAADYAQANGIASAQ